MDKDVKLGSGGLHVLERVCRWLTILGTFCLNPLNDMIY